MLRFQPDFLGRGVHLDIADQLPHFSPSTGDIDCLQAIGEVVHQLAVLVHQPRHEGLNGAPGRPVLGSLELRDWLILSYDPDIGAAAKVGTITVEAEQLRFIQAKSPP